MYRHFGGGVLFLFGILLLFTNKSSAQILLTSAKDKRPISDAYIYFSNKANKQAVIISNESGLVSLPAFMPDYIIVNAPGFQTIYDTISGLTAKSYILQPLKIQIEEVVITGQYKSSQASEAAYKVQVINEEEITQHAANNLEDLLKEENSVSLSHDKFLGAGISINGISGNNIKILMDGVPVIGRENGNIDLAQLDLSNIERVEIVKGPMSETYGSDALGGVINLISKKKKADGLAGGMKFLYESNGTYDINAHAGYRKNGNEITINLGRNYFDGYSEFDTLRSKQWKPKEQFQGDFGYTCHFRAGSLRYMFNATDEKLISKGNILATPYEAYAFDDYYNTIRNSHKVVADIQLKNQASVNLSNAFSNYQRSKISFRKDMVSLNQTELKNNNYTNFFRQLFFRGTYSTFKANRKYNFQAGYELVFDEAKGDRTGGITRTMNDYAVFGSAEIIAFKILLIRPALRVIYNDRYPAPFVPSLNLKLDPCSKVTLRGSVARGFRSPSVKELYLDFEDSNHNLKGNTGLKPELSEYAQLSADYRLKISKLEISVQPDFFVNHIYNKISLTQINNNALDYTYINIDNYRNYGGNLNLIGVLGGLKVAPGINITTYQNQYKGISGSPAYVTSVNMNGSVSYVFKKPDLTISLFVKHTGASTLYNLNDDKLTTFHINDYNTMDFTAGKFLFKKSVFVNAGVKNIFNITTTTGGMDNNDVHSGGEDVTLLGMGRYYFAGIKIDFGKK